MSQDSIEQILKEMRAGAVLLLEDPAPAVIWSWADRLQKLTKDRTSVDAGAFQMAINVLRRAGKDEIADEIERTAIRNG